MVKVALTSVLLCSVLLACGGEDDPPEPMPPPESELDSGAVCESDSDVTYTNFARQFFADYCTSCHSSELSGEERSGAPPNVNLDTLAGVVAVGKVRIDRWAGAGPNGVRKLMPPGSSNPAPTTGERERLSVWLACDLPE